MKEKTIFKKRNISLLYVYFLSGESNKIGRSFVTNRVEEWFEDFKEKKLLLEKKISFSLKKGWKLDSIPLIEKTVIIISAYEIIYLKENKYEAFKLINKVVEFSKKHLESEKFRYVNAVLDSITKEKFNF